MVIRFSFISIVFTTIVLAHELFVTMYLYSKHESSIYNEVHQAYGAEYLFNDYIGITYEHFTDSHTIPVDIVGVTNQIYFNDKHTFGLQVFWGYQKGYCFGDGIYKIIDCTPELSNENFVILPQLFYKSDYIKINFFSRGDMFTLLFSLKVYPPWDEE